MWDWIEMNSKFWQPWKSLAWKLLEEISPTSLPKYTASLIQISISFKSIILHFSLSLLQKLNGGTTVSGTMLVAAKAGIPIFVTGTTHFVFDNNF